MNADATAAPEAESIDEAAYLIATGISTLNVLTEQLTRNAPDDLENAFYGALILLKQGHAALMAAA